jgi:divalent metal cation (Fe/Co/Zn/Cd) transporter
MLFFGLRRYFVGALTSIAVTLALFLTFRYAFQVLLPIVGLFDFI